MLRHELRDGKVHRHFLDVVLQPVRFEEPTCSIGLIGLKWTKVEIGRRSSVLGIALSIDHDELHPARHDARLPVPTRFSDSVIQRHEHMWFKAVLVGLVHQDRAAL
jgi:hypothetical protein